ncbi:hypothetical protein LEP1GSC192_0961 [Leptospira sp. B5-022]|nr:hypothetical protein LEP1GSC192_0961 [Leptospira sp. B5-022]
MEAFRMHYIMVLSILGILISLSGYSPQVYSKYLILNYL